MKVVPEKLYFCPSDNINITKMYPVNAINLTAQIEQVKDKKN